MVDSVSVRLKKARVEKMPLNIRIQWNAGTACVSECVLKTLACRGLRVGPSKLLAVISPPETQKLLLTDPAFVVLPFESRDWRSSRAKLYTPPPPPPHFWP